MRAKRQKVEGETAVYHCISRICAGERLLGTGEKEVLRRMIREVAGFCGVQVLTYVVMSNHFHVLLRVEPAPEAGVDDGELVRRYEILFPAARARRSARVQPTPEVLAAILAAGGREAEAWRRRLRARMHDVSAYMKLLKQRFSVWYNRSHNRFGTLWAERYKSLIVEPSDHALATVAAYIDLNAVRAGLVKDPAHYRWCGYAEAMAGNASARAGLVRIFAGRESQWPEAAALYRLRLFGKGSGGRDDQGTVSREAVLAVIQAGGKVPVAEALRCRVRYFTEGAVLGSAAYVEKCARRCGKRSPPSNAPPRSERPPRPMEGAMWDGLMVDRGLRTKVFS